MRVDDLNKAVGEALASAEWVRIDAHTHNVDDAPTLAAATAEVRNATERLEAARSLLTTRPVDKIPGPTKENT